MPTLYRIGDAVLDPDLGRIERGGKTLELQPKLLELLLYLIAHRDRVVTREELLREVWPDAVVGDSSLMRAVSLVRSALGGSAAGESAIATQSKRGYRLVAPVEELIERGALPGADPFFGRAAPLAELERAWDAARAGRGTVALISGEAGIGKTRLASELCVRVRAAGGRALVGFCPQPGGAPPLWPWARALRDLAEQEGQRALDDAAVAARVALSDLLPERAPHDPADRVVDSASAQFALLDALERVLGTLAAQRPLLVVLDDVHWLDRSSLRALEHVARGVARQRLLVVATFRSGELEPEHPLHAALALLSRAPQGVTLRLEPLDESSAERLVSALAPSETPAGVAREIRRRSGGNPLFLRELVRAWTQDGVGPGEAGAVPPGIRELLGGRIARLPRALRNVLQAAAVLGGEIELELLRPLLGVAPAALAEALQAGVDGGWLELVSKAPLRYAFAHPLVHHALRESLPPRERTELHARAADALEREHAARLDAVQERLAEHHLELARAGHASARAAWHASRAGVLAERRLAFDEAALWYERALEALELEPSPDDALRGRLLVGVARMRWATGDRAGARAPADAAAVIARRRDDPELLAQAALVFWVRGAPPPERHPQAFALLEEASRAQRDATTPLRAELLARGAEHLSMEPGEESRTAERCEEALRLARGAGDPHTLYTVLYCMLFAIWPQLASARRRGLADELMRLAEELGDPTAPIQASPLHLTCLLEAGDLAEADAEIARFARAIERFEVPSFFRWYGSLYGAMRSILVGRLADGERLARESFEHARHACVYDAQRALATQLYAIRADEGRAPELEKPVAEMAARYPDDLSYTPLHALILAETGRLEAGRALFEPFFERYQPRQDGNRGITAALFAGLCERLGDGQRARVVYERLRPDEDLYGVNLSAWIYQGSLHWTLGKLAALCGDVRAAERHYGESLRRNEALGARPFAARTAFDHARLCAETGDLPEARRLVASALDVAREVGMLELIARAEPLAARLGGVRARGLTSS